jgi:hypothetical protein
MRVRHTLSNLMRVVLLIAVLMWLAVLTSRWAFFFRNRAVAYELRERKFVEAFTT